MYARSAVQAAPDIMLPAELLFIELKELLCNVTPPWCHLIMGVV
jgi:hypothetical protein